MLDVSSPRLRIKNRIAIQRRGAEIAEVLEVGTAQQLRRLREAGEGRVGPVPTGHKHLVPIDSSNVR